MFCFKVLSNKVQSYKVQSDRYQLHLVTKTSNLSLNSVTLNLLAKTNFELYNFLLCHLTDETQSERIIPQWFELGSCVFEAEIKE